MTTFKSFEYMHHVLDSTGKCFRIITIYRPPPSKVNKLTVAMFLDEFSTFLEQESISAGSLLIVGNFNVHCENTVDPNSKRFLGLLDSFNLCNHMTEPTHRSGHMLDLVITRKSDNIVSDIYVAPSDHLSDHSAVHFKLALAKPYLLKKKIVYRKIKNIDSSTFQKDITESSLVKTTPCNLHALVTMYDHVLRELLDKHAPIKELEVTERPSAPYYTDAIRDEKRKKRKLERQWRRTKLTVHKEIFLEQCKHVTSMLTDSKQAYYENTIQENSKDQKALFKVVDKLLHKNEEPKLPTHTSLHELCESFADFFVNKITKIRLDLSSIRSCAQHIPSKQVPNCNKLIEFAPSTEEDVQKIIMKSPSKSCILDPIPTELLKACIGPLLPVITLIVNLSLSTATMPDNMKEAILSPLLKKFNLDFELQKTSDLFPI